MTRGNERFDGSPKFIDEWAPPLPDETAMIATMMPYRTALEHIQNSASMNLAVWFKYTDYIGPIVRELAEKSADGQRPFEVLEVGNGVPLKSFFFHGDMFRSTIGDHLIAGPNRVHAQPETHCSALADHDYVNLILTSEELFADDTGNKTERHVTSLLNRILGCPAPYPVITPYTPSEKADVRQAYEEAQAAGKISTYTHPNPIEGLRNLYGAGKRYDLIFADLAGTADRMRYLQAVQACLSPGGYGLAPIEWWESTSYKSGIDRATLVDDTVWTPQGEVPLEEYLVAQFPEAFQIATPHETKTLLICGTEQPVQFPEFNAQLRSERRAQGTLSIRWTPTQ